VSITSNEEIASWLDHDYGYYSHPAESAPSLKLNIHLEAPPYGGLPELAASRYHEDYIVYDSEGLRVIDFLGRALSVYKTRENTVDIYSESQDRLYDVFHLSFESLLGEQLDRKGFHRIHCLGLEKNGMGIIILLPPGGGKTTMALKFLESRIGVLSEDMVLYKNDRLYGLHFRWGVKGATTMKGRLMRREKYEDKTLVSTRDMKLSKEANPKAIILGRRVLSDRSEIKTLPKHKLIKPLLKSMVLGLELQQSLAYFLLRSTKDGFSKTTIGLSRLKAMRRILRASSTYEFHIGSDIEKNYKTLAGFMEGL